MLQKNPEQHVFTEETGNMNFQIIDSTLREGEQFANVFFDSESKARIAEALDVFGVDYIEVTNPASSEQSRQDCKMLCSLGLTKAKILAHTRCHMDDVRIAVETGVDGVNVVMGTSLQLRTHSHGKDMHAVTRRALEVIRFVQSKGIEIRFSTEDSFRSKLSDLLELYTAVNKLGVDRVGIADTVGCATPTQTSQLVRALRGVVRCDIECHFHNDTGGAISNAFCALEAGATHIDTCVLGIGERNGITPLGGLIARMITVDRASVLSRYRVQNLQALDELVADVAGITIPFNNYVTVSSAFHHRAGIHIKAMLNDPTTYEAINPGDFGLRRSANRTSEAHRQSRSMRSVSSPCKRPARNL